MVQHYAAVPNKPLSLAMSLLVQYVAELKWLLMYCDLGSLGCGIGYGYLHRIPTRTAETTSPKAFPPSGSSSPVKAPVQVAGFNEVASHC